MTCVTCDSCKACVGSTYKTSFPRMLESSLSSQNSSEGLPKDEGPFLSFAFCLLNHVPLPWSEQPWRQHPRSPESFTDAKVSRKFSSWSLSKPFAILSSICFS